MSILLLALFTLTFSSAAFSDNATSDKATAVETDSQYQSSSDAWEDIFAETKARLNLSEEQVEQITPILQSSFESRRAILQKYGIDIESRQPPAQKLGFARPAP